MEALGEPIPRTNRRTVPSSDGQCFFRALADALTRYAGPLRPGDGMWWIDNIGGHPWCRNIRGIRRYDIRVTMKCVAMHVLECVTDEEFAASGLLQRYADRKAYADRLERGPAAEGQNEWGSIADLQMALHWLGHSNFGNFGVSIYTIESTNYTLARVTKHTIIIRQPPNIVRDLDIVLYNSGNFHWMNTVVDPNLPAVVDNNGNGIGPGPGVAEREIIEID